MVQVVTINRPDVVSLIERAAERMTGGNKTEVVGLALRRLLAGEERFGSLFGRRPGSVIVAEGVDLTAPTFDEEMDSETGREIDR